MRNSPVADLLGNETTAVECMHCGVRMTSHLGSGQRVRYFRCGSCHRWVSTTYADIFSADSKVRAVQPEAPQQAGNFGAVKTRLERWLASLEEQDPYRTLGVSPMDSPDTVRARYHQLALERHPDRGGSPEQMQELNAAYERIVGHRERRVSEALSSVVAAGPCLPASNR